MKNSDDISVYNSKKIFSRSLQFFKLIFLVAFSIVTYSLFRFLFTNNPRQQFLNSNAEKENSDSLQVSSTNSYVNSLKKLTRPTITLNKLDITTGQKVPLTQADLIAIVDPTNTTANEELVFDAYNIKNGHFLSSTEANITTFTQEQVDRGNEIYFKHNGSNEKPEYTLIAETPGCANVSSSCASTPNNVEVDFTQTSNSPSNNKVAFAVGIASGIVGLMLATGAYFGIRKVKRMNAEREAIRTQDPFLYDFLKYLGIKNLTELMQDHGWKETYDKLLLATSLVFDELRSEQQQQVLKAMAASCKYELAKSKVECNANNIDTYFSEISESLQRNIKSIDIGRASLTSKPEDESSLRMKTIH